MGPVGFWPDSGGWRDRVVLLLEKETTVKPFKLTDRVVGAARLGGAGPARRRAGRVGEDAAGSAGRGANACGASVTHNPRRGGRAWTTGGFRRARATASANGRVAAASEAASEHGGGTAGDFFSMLFVFMLATFIGIGVIRRVSRLLHTPLMSLTNAISAISVVGAIIVAGGQHYPMAHPGPGRGGPVRVDDEHHQRLSDHRPHAQDVQDARGGQGMNIPSFSSPTWSRPRCSSSRCTG